MKILRLNIAFVCLLSTAAVAVADERTFETQAALSALGYEVGSIDGSWGKKTEKAITKFAEENGANFNGEVTPSLWVSLAAKARSSFPIPYLSLSEPLKSNGQRSLLISATDIFKPEACQWLVEFYQNPAWGRGQPVTARNYLGRFGGILLSDVAEIPDFFESQSNEMHDALVASTQSCYAGGKGDSCATLIDTARLMKEQSAFVFNTPIESIGNGTFYYTTKRILNPALVGYAIAIEKEGVPSDHAEIGDWFYAALIQNSFDPFLPERLQQKDMLFYPPPSGVTGACDKHALSFNHSLYQSLGLSFYGAIWNDENAASQAFDRLIYSLDSGGLSEDGVMLCEASRGSNAMMYSGATMLNILYVIELARNQGIDIESSEVVSKIDKAGTFLYESAFDLSKIKPYASENFLSWCDEDYNNQCMYNGFGRIASFSWMRHFVDLFPESPLSEKILEIRSAPAATEGELFRVSGAIAKSNFLISEVAWEVPQELEDNHESQTRSRNGPQYLNIMDANLFSNICAVNFN
jgi:hypothetical protein